MTINCCFHGDVWYASLEHGGGSGASRKRRRGARDNEERWVGGKEAGTKKRKVREKEKEQCLVNGHCGGLEVVVPVIFSCI